MIYPIQTGEQNPILHTVCSPVERFDAALENFAEDLITTMTTKNEYGQIGVGIAAPQVGDTRRVMVVTMNAFDSERNLHKRRKVQVMVNPEILHESNLQVTLEEGCLSLPHLYGDVRRAARVHAAWYTPSGTRVEKKLSGWDARIFLHELDHLNGILFTERMSGSPSYEPPTDEK
ncbi:peptide deformylase [Candidatus Peribacteria bacterium]|nr:peptide deformylase [Candidatus Peribacteria bacterium]